jgi:hypothetical protein
MRASVGILGVAALLAVTAACLSSPGQLDPYAGGPALSPPAPTTAPRGTIAFSASGGSGEGYRFALAVNKSGGAMDATTGTYVAGAQGSVVDVVQVEDSIGRVTLAAVTVGRGVTISPSGMGMAPSTSALFTASGGSGAGYSWSLARNLSGAVVQGSGYYTAGSTQGVSDLLEATDSLGNVATAQIDVGDVVVFPASATVLAGSTRTFSAGVTSEPNLDVSWDVVEGAAGGAIVATTPEIFPYSPKCTYLAPATPGTFHLRARSLGNPAKFGLSVIVVVPSP